MGIQLQTIGRSIEAVRGVGPSGRAAKKDPSKKNLWPQLLLIALPSSNKSSLGIKGLRSRLSYLASLERSVEKARTPYEERFYVKSIKLLFEGLQRSGLIGKSSVKSLQSTKSRRHLARSMVATIKKAIRKRIAELVEIGQVKLMDLPPDNAPKKKRITPMRGTRGVRFYLKLLKELPKN